MYWEYEMAPKQDKNGNSNMWRIGSGYDEEVEEEEEEEEAEADGEEEEAEYDKPAISDAWKGSSIPNRNPSTAPWKLYTSARTRQSRIPVNPILVPKLVLDWGGL